MILSICRLVFVAGLLTLTLATVPVLEALQSGQPSDDPAAREPVYDLGADITPPKVVHQVSPKPDSGSKGFRISGTVLIGLVVSSEGLPVNVHVSRSVEKDIDESAMAAVREWRFEPARKAGKAVAVRVTVEIRFQDL